MEEIGISDVDLEKEDDYADYEIVDKDKEEKELVEEKAYLEDKADYAVK
jgi:hypothetical protein